jgi:hypothetical protein
MLSDYTIITNRLWTGKKKSCILASPPDLNLEKTKSAIEIELQSHKVKIIQPPFPVGEINNLNVISVKEENFRKHKKEIKTALSDHIQATCFVTGSWQILFEALRELDNYQKFDLFYQSDKMTDCNPHEITKYLDADDKNVLTKVAQGRKLEKADLKIADWHYQLGILDKKDNKYSICCYKLQNSLTRNLSPEKFDLLSSTANFISKYGLCAVISIIALFCASGIQFVGLWNWVIMLFFLFLGVIIYDIIIRKNYPLLFQIIYWVALLPLAKMLPTAIEQLQARLKNLQDILPDMVIKWLLFIWIGLALCTTWMGARIHYSEWYELETLNAQEVLGPNKLQQKDSFSLNFPKNVMADNDDYQIQLLASSSIMITFTTTFVDSNYIGTKNKDGDCNGILSTEISEFCKIDFTTHNQGYDYPQKLPITITFYLANTPYPLGLQSYSLIHEQLPDTYFPISLFPIWLIRINDIQNNWFSLLVTFIFFALAEGWLLFDIVSFLHKKRWLIRFADSLRQKNTSSLQTSAKEPLPFNSDHSNAEVREKWKNVKILE